MNLEKLIIALYWRSFAFVYFGYLFLFFDFSILGFLVHDVLNSRDWGGYLIFSRNYKYNYSFGFFFTLFIHMLLSGGNFTWPLYTGNMASISSTNPKTLT